MFKADHAQIFFGDKPLIETFPVNPDPTLEATINDSIDGGEPGEENTTGQQTEDI